MKKRLFAPVTPNVNFPELEERVIEYWKKNKIFEKTLTKDAPKGDWTFLDGPPFITGLPHYGSLLSSIPKDLFPRYKTMQGYRVRRVWGWDCHGLPAENKVEEKLGIKRKKDIEEKVGIKKFIDECKAYVGKTSSEWEWYVDHVGRWVDFKNAYKTMDTSYMETVMWVFKQMYDKGYIYKGLRVSLYCPHCATPISNFEVAMDSDNYKDVTEPTAVFMYQLVDELDTYLLAWSTTPWNKLATPALAVNPKLSYIKVQEGDKKYILAKSTVDKLKGKYKVLGEVNDLVGKKFVKHYDFYSKDPGVVIAGDFVTAEEGTGIVTIAAYGEEDLKVMLRDKIQLVLHVDEEGILKKDVPFAGTYYLKADPLVIEDLTKRHLIYRIDSYTHSVPTCWRCHTRLYYAPQNAWYVDVQQLKPLLKKTNEKVNWYPEHFKYGRYLKSLQSAPDWCISRSRYWGSPVPVWECPNGHRFVPGSIAELEEASGKKIDDLHKPLIDEVTVQCKTCGKTAKRVPEVLDSWIEAGSASLAERHFPFEKIDLKTFFPPDFIVEYTGQIRAWFYVLHVISVAIFSSHAFKNVVVTGVILGTDGRKMSKNYGNYPDPKEMITTYGGDALRLYLMGSPVMHGEDIRISKEDYRNEVRGMMLILWNVYNFFVSYANVDKWAISDKRQATSKNILDQWILSLLHQLTIDVTKHLENYDTVSTVNVIQKFVTDLSQWYVRRSRDRVGPAAQDAKDKNACYATLYEVLVTICKLIAPITPFFAEEIYRNVTSEESVHLASWPAAEATNSKLSAQMVDGMLVSSAGHAFRKLHKVKVRIPFKKLRYQGPRKLPDEIKKIILSEINVYDVSYDKKTDNYAVGGQADEDNQDVAEGVARGLIREVQKLRKEKSLAIDDTITLTLAKDYKSLSPKLVEYIKRETLARDIVWGDTLAIS